MGLRSSASSPTLRMVLPMTGRLKTGHAGERHPITNRHNEPVCGSQKLEIPSKKVHKGSGFAEFTVTFCDSIEGTRNQVSPMSAAFASFSSNSGLAFMR